MAKLNDLTGKEWIQFTKSWFKVTAKSRGNKEIQVYLPDLKNTFLISRQLDDTPPRSALH